MRFRMRSSIQMMLTTQILESRENMRNTCRNLRFWANILVTSLNISGVQQITMDMCIIGLTSIL